MTACSASAAPCPADRPLAGYIPGAAVAYWRSKYSRYAAASRIHRLLSLLAHAAAGPSPVRRHPRRSAVVLPIAPMRSIPVVGLRAFTRGDAASQDDFVRRAFDVTARLFAPPASKGNRRCAPFGREKAITA